jgi:hypothetical protein
MIESRIGVGAAFFEDTEKADHNMAHGAREGRGVIDRR